MKNILVIGGTGILGRPLVEELVKSNEYKVYSVALNRAEDPTFPSQVQEVVIDRYSDKYSDVVRELHEQVDGSWDAVIDLIAYDEKGGEQTYQLFKDSTQHFITISTALVYDRREEIKEPISEQIPLASEGEYGGYVDGKIRLEKFWQNTKNINWTLLRPYHILGRWSLLGCLPHHNRDPQLIERINNGEVLSIANKGNISFNYIHPADVASAIHKIIGNSKTFGQAYNLTNPVVLTGTEYYKEIGKQLSKEVHLENVAISKVWEEMKGWEMTTLPHVYNIEKLIRDIAFTPSISLSQGVKDAIEHFPLYDIPVEQIPVHAHMNKLPRPKKPVWLE